MGLGGTKLDSLTVIKQWWMWNEWDPRCKFSKHIQIDFAERDPLHPVTGSGDVEAIEATFWKVRGAYILWQEEKEHGRWKRVDTDLELSWVERNVEVLYPVPENYELTRLDGIVLWKDPTKEKYQLLEGNHRISTWLRLRQPAILPSIVFFGKPQKI